MQCISELSDVCQVKSWVQAGNRRWRRLFGVLGHEGSHPLLLRFKKQINKVFQLKAKVWLTHVSILLCFFFNLREGINQVMKSPTAPLHYPVDNIHICKNICQACLDPTSGPDRLSYRAHNTYVEVNFIQLKKYLWERYNFLDAPQVWWEWGQVFKVNKQHRSWSTWTIGPFD